MGFEKKVQVKSLKDSKTIKHFVYGSYDLNSKNLNWYEVPTNLVTNVELITALTDALAGNHIVIDGDEYMVELVGKFQKP